jgi:predicted RNA binding protein YcfA (HicA-like mRNA interferase family)
VKRRDLEAALSALGWRHLRAGGKHDIWAKDERTLAVPRHNEINEHTARGILKAAAR